MNLAGIDEIKQAELKLRESQNFSQKISETTPGLVTVFNVLDGQYFYVNYAIKTILGYEPTDFIIGGFAFAVTLLHPDDLSRITSENAGRISLANSSFPEFDDNSVMEFEYRMKHKDGNYVWLKTYGVIFNRSEDNLVEKILNISVDITTTKKTEEELQKTKEDLLRLNKELEAKVIERTTELETEKLALRRETERNSLVDKATNDVVWDCDLVSNIMRWNDNFTRLFGYDVLQVEANNDSWLKRIHPDDRPRVTTGIDEVFRNKSQQWSAEYRFIRRDNSYANILDRGYILYNDAGTPYRMVGCMTDISRHKEAEEKARTNELKFRRIYESNMMGMVFSGYEGNILEANNAFLNMIGYTQEDISQGILNWDGITATGSLETSRLAVEQLKMHGVCPPFEKDYVHKNGQLISALVGSAALPAENNNYAVTYVIDLTQSKHDRKVIEETEDRFRFIADSIPQKIWTADPEGKVSYMNKVWLDFTGKTFEELTATFDATHPDDRERTIQNWQNAVIVKEAFEIEHRYRRYDGVYRWHLSRGVPQKDAKGNVILWVGSNTDINDQKSIAEALSISEDYFRGLADNVPFFIWKVDLNGEANYVNKSWINFTGLSFEESIGFGWASALHPDEREDEYANFKVFFDKREPYQSKFRLRRKDGQYRYVLNQARPLLSPEFIGFIGSLTDITEQELAQQATEKLMQRKDEFMSIASHELKTPITSMKAYLQIVERLSGNNPGISSIHSFIEKANKQVNKLASLVEDLLDVTKIHAGKMEFNKTVFRIKDAIDDCLDEVKNDNETHHVSIGGTLSQLVFADKHRVEQVISNFLSNAIKYSPEANDIQINVTSLASDIKISVIDKGIGIPEDKIKFVFDRFFRVQESSQKFSGLGLGLYISSEIISRHNGNIGVESKEGAGSEFWFTLPLTISS